MAWVFVSATVKVELAATLLLGPDIVHCVEAEDRRPEHWDAEARQHRAAVRIGKGKTKEA